MKSSHNQNMVLQLIEHLYPLPIEDELISTFNCSLRDGMRILDAGCGIYRGCPRGNNLKNLYVVGVDADPNVHQNPTCDETIECDLSNDLPFENNSFDMIHCRWVTEHLSNPQKSFCEFQRILKPGGSLFILTPNIYHYATIVARVTPYQFHKWWRNTREREIFPTYYRANSKCRLYKLCRTAGLHIKKYKSMEGPPYYLERHWFIFLLGVFYERLVNTTPLFAFLRQQIFVEATKPSAILKTLD
jgi:SAM-dependent methyltransferase